MAPNCSSSLPSEILIDILCRLPISDYIRSGAVCTSWRRATAGKNPRRNPKSPLLMLPGAGEDPDNPDSLRFFTLDDRTQRSFHLRQIGKKRSVVGSSHGSIMVMDGKAEILLLDPHTGAELLLPPPPSSRPFPPFLIQKLVLSPSASGAVAMGDPCFCRHDQHHLSSIHLGNDSWSLIRKEDRRHPFDFALHKGQLYVAFHDGALLSFHPADDKSMTFHGHGDLSFDDYDRMYLVESLDCDHLLLVCRMNNSFRVFRHDPLRLEWAKVRSLGEVAIFVGTSYSVCVFTRGMPELRGNCVYFTEDRTGVPAKDDFGVFDLEERSTRLVSLRYNRRTKRSPSPFWFMPSSS